MRKFNLIIITLFLVLISGFYLDNLILNLTLNLRTNFLDNFFIFIDKYFNYYLLAVIISLMPFLLKKNKKKIFIKLWLTFILSGIISYLLKIIIQRPRPIISIIENASFSFPSGHTTIMFSLLPLIWHNFNKKIKYSWLIISLIIAFSRIYLGVHYFSDIIAGILFGLLIGNFILFITNSLKNKKWLTQK